MRRGNGLVAAMILALQLVVAAPATLRAQSAVDQRATGRLAEGAGDRAGHEGHSSDTAAVRKAVLADREAIWRAWFSNDQEALERLLPQHVIAINSGDSVWQDRAAVLAASAQFVRDGGKLVGLSFPRTDLQVYGNVAITYSTYRLELESGGRRATIQGRATEIFIHQAGRWRNAGWHLDAGS